MKYMRMKHLLFLSFLVVAGSICAEGRDKPAPTDTPAAQCELLDRGFVNIRTSATSSFLSWRLFATDDAHISFQVLKDGEPFGDVLRTATSRRVSSRETTRFQLVTLQNGVPVDTVEAVTFNNLGYHLLQLDRPAGGTNEDGDYTYSPNDMSVGDVDGDGQYELFVKWDPSNSKDNSQDGYTGNVYLDCYRLFTGEKLWRIDLGPNIRAGAHYTQFLVYDFDKDGKAELMCKTAPGSKDGTGTYVNQAADNATIKAASNTKDWRVSGGRVNGGHEYLTVFEGLTGKAIHTIAYYPNRNATAALSDAAGTFNWDDRSGKSDKGNYGNRGERYLAAVAYLDGADKLPSGIFSRGYYTYAYIWAVDFDGQKLKTRWLHSSDTKTSYKVLDAQGKTATYTSATSSAKEGRNTMYGNGNHNLSVADVDGDGCDEVLWGSAALNNDGKLLYSVGFGHGDAIHLGDLNPDRPGLELFDIHEDKGKMAWDVHDAATGEILWQGGAEGIDNGRGLAADIVASKRGYEFWSAYGGFDKDKDNRNQNPFNAITGEQAGSKSASMNFRIYWDGDAQDELLDGTGFDKDGTGIGKWTASGTNSLGIYTTSSVMKSFADLGMTPSSCNSTKSTPCLSADIFGDWREEVIWWNVQNPSQVYIVSTTTKTDYRVPTLMHDHVYRMGIAWQNCAYNQPPHLGYYLPDYIQSFQGVEDEEADGVSAASATRLVGETVCYNLSGQRIAKPQPRQVYIERQLCGDGSVVTRKKVGE